MLETTYNETEVKIPVRILNELGDYVETGEIPGKFLRAVLNNDLQAAVNEADDVELDAIKPLLTYIKARVPIGCYGYSDAIINWNQRKTNEAKNG